MKNKLLKISIIGCGTIGSALAEAIENKFSAKAKLEALCDLDKKKVDSLISKLKVKPKILAIDQLITQSDLVIEAASSKIVEEVVKKCIKFDKDVIIMSIGGFIGNEYLFDMAENSNCYIHLPTGALCGLDGVKGANEAEIEKVELISRKPPEGLKGAPYLKENNIDIDNIKGEILIFEGTARDAIKGFPKNVNVASLLSIVGKGPDETKVKILSSPDYTTNSHKIVVEGDFGKLEAKTDNFPSPKNPKTSFLAILSCVATLRRILSHVKIGS
jgi:aspartate dehydrogenase